MEIMDAATNVNDSMPHYIIGKATAALSGSLEDKQCAVLGLSFKSGTSDARHSPAIVIANTLIGGGAKVRVYDPQAAEGVTDQLDKKITVCASIDEAIKDSDCVFIATDWQEFIDMSDEQFSGIKLLVDCMNCIDHAKLPKTVQYMGVGK
jgi:UDPglucose 6-dehydrogenase